MYIFLHVKDFCICVTRLRMTLSTENWATVYTSYSQICQVLGETAQTGNLYSKKSCLGVPTSSLAWGSSDQSPQRQRVHIGGLVEGRSGGLLSGGTLTQSDSAT